MVERIVKPIRVGLVGAGNWANHGHLRVLQLLPEYQVTAVQARRREAAETAAAQYAIPLVFTAVEELVASPDVDLVLVLNTAPQHADTVRAAIVTGKDVYCEWPLTVSTATAEELGTLAGKFGVQHFVGLQRRLAPHNRYLKDLLHSGYVGRLRSVRMHVSMNYFQARRMKALEWTVPPENFSSVIAIYAGHFLDMIFYAIGRPDALSCDLINQFKEVTIVETGTVISTNTPDQLVLTARLKEDAILSVHLEGGKRNGSGVQIDITGDEGDLRITNVAAFGDIGDDYVIQGAHGDNLSLAPLPIPASYFWLTNDNLPSSVLELANLYVAFARQDSGDCDALPTFRDAIWLHHFFDTMTSSSISGKRQTVRSFE
jgi:predicted dehydrogenase